MMILVAPSVQGPKILSKLMPLRFSVKTTCPGFGTKAGAAATIGAAEAAAGEADSVDEPAHDEAGVLGRSPSGRQREGRASHKGHGEAAEATGDDHHRVAFGDHEQERRNHQGECAPDGDPLNAPGRGRETGGHVGDGVAEEPDGDQQADLGQIKGKFILQYPERRNGGVHLQSVGEREQDRHDDGRVTAKIQRGATFVRHFCGSHK